MCSPAKVSGYKDEIDASTWLISEVTHRFDKAGGFIADIRMERLLSAGPAVDISSYFRSGSANPDERLAVDRLRRL